MVDTEQQQPRWPQRASSCSAAHSWWRPAGSAEVRTACGLVAVCHMASAGTESNIVVVNRRRSHLKVGGEKIKSSYFSVHSLGTEPIRSPVCDDVPELVNWRPCKVDLVLILYLPLN